MITPPRDEPDLLKDGKHYHAEVQQDWLGDDTIDGVVQTEVHIKKPSGRPGRIDVFVDTKDNLVVAIEIKSTQWDKITEKNVRRNVRKHIRQVWDYMESLMGPDNEGTPVAPALLYKYKPADPAKVEVIEALCEEFAVQVVWEEWGDGENRQR